MLGLRDLVFIAPNPSSLHHHHQAQPITASSDHSNLPLPSSAALSVGLGIFPLLTATPCIPQQHHNNNVHDQAEEQGCNNTGNYHNYWNLKMCPEVEFDSSSSARKGVIHVEQNEENNNSIYGPDFRVCQDCGNKAKKDCGYKRCRTCCKGRGYDCSTHVRSTWVPTASRRRDQRDVAVVGGGDSPQGAKRMRGLGSSLNDGSISHSSNSNATMTKSFDTSSCHRDAGFKQSLPGKVSAPAVFKCHRVSAIGNGEYELAYLATVHISGHVFKGFLYDQGGVDAKNEGMPCISELQLMRNNCTRNNNNNNNNNDNNNNDNNNNGEFSSAIGVPTSAYPASAC